MKTLMLTLFTAVVTTVSFTQDQNWTNTVVQESEVPSAVTSTFKTKYNPSKIVRWEKRTWQGKDKLHTKYVVIFDQDGLRQRARYMDDGSGISATTYYWLKNVEKLPEAVKNYASTKYPDFKLESGEKELNLKKGTYVYRIRLRKGKATKLVVYVNENGEEINKDNVDKEILENESETVN